MAEKEFQKAYCETCDGVVVCPMNMVETEEAETTIRGVKVKVKEKYVRCPNCGEKLCPNSLIDYNVISANRAYCDMLGHEWFGGHRFLYYKPTGE